MTQERNIAVINAAAPCLGIFTTEGPPEWHPADAETKQQCREAVQCCQDHDMEIVRLAIWYSMQCKDIATNLIGMQNLKQLQTNLDILLNGITEEEKKILKEIQEK